MSLSPEALYHRLGHLLESVPNLHTFGPLPQDAETWIAQAVALIEASGDIGDHVEAKQASNQLVQYQKNLEVRVGAALRLVMLVRRALVRAELRAPASALGAFIPAGDVFEAFIAVGKILSTAQTHVLFVDPYDYD